MSSDNIKSQIEFTLEHQAKFRQDIEQLKEVQAQQTVNINKLFETTASTQAHLDSVISEMRDGF